MPKRRASSTSLTAAVLALLLAGCAGDAPTAGAKAPVRQAAPALGPSEPAPVPRIRETRTIRYFWNPSRVEMGWPDRFSGAPPGGPFRPRF